MNHLRCFIYIACIAIVVSCKSEEKSVVIPVEEILIPKEISKNIKFEELFSAWQLVPLETNKNSLISSISRIQIFNRNFFILDRQTNSVIIFNNVGKFLYRVRSLGNGIGKYISLQDFTIDEKNRRLILYSDRPSKTLYFDLSGKFIEEKPYSGFFGNVSFLDDKLMFLQMSGPTENTLMTDDLISSKRIFSLPPLKNYKLFETLRLPTPNIVRSKGTFISFLYSDTIFKIEEGRALPRYHINFVNNNIPEDFLVGRHSSIEIYKKAIDGRYGFAIANFRENERNISFTYGDNIIVIYSKSRKKASAFYTVENHQNLIPFANIIAHDGNDGYMISILDAPRFKWELEPISRKSKEWNNLPVNVKILDSTINILSNPILQIYTMKD